MATTVFTNPERYLIEPDAPLGITHLHGVRESVQYVAFGRKESGMFIGFCVRDSSFGYGFRRTLGREVEASAYSHTSHEAAMPKIGELIGTFDAEVKEIERINDLIGVIGELGGRQKVLRDLETAYEAAKQAVELVKGKSFDAVLDRIFLRKRKNQIRKEIDGYIPEGEARTQRAKNLLAEAQMTLVTSFLSSQGLRARYDEVDYLNKWLARNQEAFSGVPRKFRKGFYRLVGDAWKEE